MKTKHFQGLARAYHQRGLGAMLCTVCLWATAHAQPQTAASEDIATPTIATPCYGPRDGAPPVQHLTVVLIDRTAPKQGAAWRDFNAAVNTALGASGQRVVILPFAGLAPGQTLARALDAVVEAPVTDTARQDMVIADYKRVQSCVARRQTQIRQAAAAQLLSLGQENPAPLARSEVLYALEATLSEFATSPQPLRLLVYSDGLQNGSGLNFYAQGAPRAIQPERELQRWKIEAAKAAFPHARVLWWGLLAQVIPLADRPAAGKAAAPRYLDAQTLAGYQRFWSEALARLGVANAAIGPTLNNPDLSFPSPGP